jgi:hypothetical protein
MGWLEYIARWRPSDETAPFLAQAILVCLALGMVMCALVTLTR